MDFLYGTRRQTPRHFYRREGSQFLAIIFGNLIISLYKYYDHYFLYQGTIIAGLRSDIVKIFAQIENIHRIENHNDKIERQFFGRFCFSKRSEKA